MKILAFTTRLSNSNYEADLVSEIDKRKPNLVLLPGIQKNTPNQKSLSEIARKYKTSIVSEIDGRKMTSTPSIIRSNGSLEKLPKQTFTTSTEIEAINRFEKTANLRVKKIGKKRIFVVMCGEINGFQLNGKLKRGLLPEFDIMVNAVHWTMGHWNHLRKKYQEISKGGRLVAHLANNTKRSWTGSIKVFLNGKELKPEIFENYASLIIST